MDDQPHHRPTLFSRLAQTARNPSPKIQLILGLALAGAIVFAAVRQWARPSHANMLQNGLSYMLGRGEPRNFHKAMACFRVAADAGSARAMNNIGDLYSAGEGVPRSYGRAMIWYRRAARLGVADAMNNIGVLYANGDGVPRDYVKGMAWFRKAAGHGSGKAMLAIGVLYEQGDGVPQDRGKAMAWYAKAAISNDPQARRMAESAMARLHPVHNPGSRQVLPLHKAARHP